MMAAVRFRCSYFTLTFSYLIPWHSLQLIQVIVLTQQPLDMVTIVQSWFSKETKLRWSCCLISLFLSHMNLRTPGPFLSKPDRDASRLKCIYIPWEFLSGKISKFTRFSGKASAPGSAVYPSVLPTFLIYQRLPVNQNPAKKIAHFVQI